MLKRYALALVGLVACGSSSPQPPSTTTETSSGGGGASSTTSSSSSTSTTSTTSNTGGTGAGGADPGMPWKAGNFDCSLLEPIPASPRGPALICQRFSPPGRTVIRVGTTVAKDKATGPAGALGGPYGLAWGTGPADGSFDSAPRVWQEVAVADSEVKFVSANIGFTDRDIEPFDLLPDEKLWVCGRLDTHAPAPSADVVCKNNKNGTAADTFALYGSCPGAGCTVMPLPAPFTGMGGLHIARGTGAP